MASKSSQRRRQKSRKFIRQGPPPEIPFLVLLAVSDRVGSRLTRKEAVFRATALAVLSPLVFSLLFFLDDELFLMPLFGSMVLLAFAVSQWLAIRWLDRHDAWRQVRR